MGWMQLQLIRMCRMRPPLHSPTHLVLLSKPWSYNGLQRSKKGTYGLQRATVTASYNGSYGRSFRSLWKSYVMIYGMTYGSNGQGKKNSYGNLR